MTLVYCDSDYEGDCESDCSSDCKSVNDTEKVVWYCYNEECNESVFSETSKANFAKWTEGRTVKKRVSVVDSDEEC